METIRQVEIPQSFICETVEFESGFKVDVAPDCPKDVADKIKSLIKENGVEWFFDGFQAKWINPSTRDIYFPKGELSGQIVLKKKHPRENVWPKTKFYTTSTTHEIVTSLAVHKILSENFSQTSQIELAGEYDSLYMQETSISVQTAYGAITHKENEDQKYGIFAYVKGESIRNQFEEYGTWNDAPFWLRKLAGSVQGLLDRVAVGLLKNGIEPWDLGAHQIVYRWKDSVLHLTILDTEEYDFGFNQRFNIETFEFLEPKIVFMYLGIK